MNNARFQWIGVPWLLALLLVGCGDGTAGGSGSGSSGGDGSSVSSGDGHGARFASADPCTLLSDALLGEHFEMSADAPVNRRPSQYSPHPLCIVQIPKPNAEELAQAQAAAMNDYLLRKTRGEDVALPSIKAYSEVSLTLLEPAESPAQALANFDGAMRKLTEGVTGGTETRQVTIQADVVPVDGVGDKAAWAESMRQLSVVDGVQVLHLTVNAGESRADDRQRAVALAQGLLNK
ncbi:hypothetical protein [Parahaliea mediterranea]|uniref:hypothetical protein n=1 Tax=Parahaliea mediterranea TaxID=651086 RepID=UPI000E2E7B7A|nr:hypothetical protein [Parahaliea mediterranea]